VSERPGGWEVLMSERDDRQDISELLVRYATGIDRRDWPLFRTCFTEDCDFDYGDIGAWQSVDAITEFMVKTHESLGHTMHRITNQAVTLSPDQPDRAEARALVDVLIMTADGKSGFNTAGFYDDELVRTDDGWRIARRRFTAVRMAAV
jgi:3-phenylpropionate/cinnamic acid dioxygenase small subunit